MNDDYYIMTMNYEHTFGFWKRLSVLSKKRLFMLLKVGQQWQLFFTSQLENGRYGHAPIRSDTSTPCVGVPATCNIRPGRSLRERS